MHQSTLLIATQGRGFTEISQQVQEHVSASGISTGLVHVFLKHTSASLTLTENADPTVLQDLETIIARLAPDGDSEYRHDYEGDDDMAAHVRSVLTSNDLTIPIAQGQLALGTWQGIFLWEHRYRSHQRSLLMTIIGR